MFTTEKFHARLQEEMEARQMSINELAEASGLAYHTVDNLIRNKREPKMETFLALIAGLNTTVDAFLAEDNGKRKKSPIQYEIERVTGNATDTQAKVILAYAKGILKGGEI